jgi:hypothetical protein
MESNFTAGKVVQVHSLKAREFNGLVGTVIGIIEKNNVKRVQLRLPRTNGTKHIVSLQPKHLTILSAFPDTFLQEALFEAVIGGNPQTTKKCLMLGANVNMPHDNFGVTPVFIAAEKGCVNVVKVLAEHGADVNTPDDHGVSPVQSCSREPYQGHQTTCCSRR